MQRWATRGPLHINTTGRQSFPPPSLLRLLQGRRAKGTLDKLTNAQLQQALRHYGLPVSGKKSELVARIENHLSKQAA